MKNKFFNKTAFTKTNRLILTCVLACFIAICISVASTVLFHMEAKQAYASSPMCASSASHLINKTQRTLLTNLVEGTSKSCSSTQETQQNSVGQVAMYRLYNKWTGEHFYTSNKDERDKIIKAGWSDENLGWITPLTSNTPVYRLYNSYAPGGDHHYTFNKSEYDSLKKSGWTQEGVAWYSVDFDSVYKTAVYRQYNPNQFSCNHNYTISTDERDTLIKAGWNDEGIGWQGLDFGKMQELDFSKITVDTSSKVYCGEEIKPSVTSATYKSGTDYIVSYESNKNAGTAKIIVSGTGAYYGQKSYTFEITKRIVGLTWSNVEFTYDGFTHTPTATATNVVAGEKVNVTVSGGGIDAGDYTATATKLSNDNYQLPSINTTSFSIEKADPVYAPAGLQGYLEQELSSVTLPSPGAGETPATSIIWNDPSTIMNEIGNKTFGVTFTPEDTSNYNTLTNLQVTVKVLKNYSEVTFNANAPSGCSVTLDGENKTSVTKNLKFDDMSATVKQHVLVTSDFPTVENTTGESKYIFAGWSTNKDDAVVKGSTTIKTVADLIEDKATLSNDTTTYYAIWMESTGYWLGTKDASERYESEAYFVMHDNNYVASSVIESDMTALHGSSASSAYTTAKNKWDGYYEGDNVRLYARYAGGETEGSYDSTGNHNGGPTSEKNKYVEFRILEVSGDAGHKYDGTNSDGSVVTFMATHLLPTAYSMNDTATNVGGWDDCALQKKMNNTDGEIYKKFSNDFTAQVRKVIKMYGTGDSTSNTTTGSYKFWILSTSEFVGSTATIQEGLQYSWCKNKSITWNNSNDVLSNWETRAIAGPGSASYKGALWWERTPRVDESKSFLYVGKDGYVVWMGNLGSDANSAWGVAPAFCF